MFAFHCPRHETRRLVWASDVEGVVNGAEGLGVVFHCSCGFHGLLVTPHDGGPERIVELGAEDVVTAA